MQNTKDRLAAIGAAIGYFVLAVGGFMALLVIAAYAGLIALAWLMQLMIWVWWTYGEMGLNWLLGGCAILLLLMLWAEVRAHRK